MTPGKIVISARSEELGDDVGEIDAMIEGEETRIAFNGKYLTDVLSILSPVQTAIKKAPDGHPYKAEEAAQVALETTNPSSPGVIRPVGSDNYVHVVMPMFVQW